MVATLVLTSMWLVLAAIAFSEFWRAPWGWEVEKRGWIAGKPERFAISADGGQDYNIGEVRYRPFDCGSQCAVPIAID
jgi:hypothetical protein